MDRYFEDFGVGERFETSSLTVTSEDIIAFARAYDPQPFHVDPVAAKKSVFGRLVASGWQTTAYTMRLIVDAGFFGSTGGIGMGVDELRWLRPVFPGDTLRVAGEVIGARPSASKATGIVHCKMATYNQHGEAVLSQTTIVQVPRRPPPVQAA